MPTLLLSVVVHTKDHTPNFPPDTRAGSRPVAIHSRRRSSWTLQPSPGKALGKSTTCALLCRTRGPPACLRRAAGHHLYPSLRALPTHNPLLLARVASPDGATST
eukprot:356647-Chlamydomonas_euryale.AAC.4